MGGWVRYLLDQLVVEGLLQKMVLFHVLDNARLLVQSRGRNQQGLQIHPLRLVMQHVRVHLKVLDLSNHIIKFAVTELRHVPPDFLSHHEEEVNHVLGLPAELLAQERVLWWWVSGWVVEFKEGGREAIKNRTAWVK